MNRVDIEALREIVKGFVTGKRYIHTLGVEEEACALGKIFLPNKLQSLSIAALLHDITKSLSLEKQLALCEEYGIAVDKTNVCEKLLHSKTGCEFAKRHIGAEIVDEEIYNGIFYHTTGRERMTLFEAIIYLADYIEKNRTFEDCVILRKYFYDNLEKCNTMEEKTELLRVTMIKSYDMTIKNLIDEGKQIDFGTIQARNYFINNEKCFF